MEVPLDLLRLSSSTATYMAILRDIEPALVALAKFEAKPATGGAGPIARLRDQLWTALDADEQWGTPAAILRALRPPYRRGVAHAFRPRRPLWPPGALFFRIVNASPPVRHEVVQCVCQTSGYM